MSNRPTGRKNSARQARIKYLTQQIASLTKELDNLVIEELDQGTTTELQLGDTVIITNNHRGLQGKQAVIVKISNKQVTLRLQGGEIVQRSKNNVRKI
jgi:hypothetical protein